MKLKLPLLSRTTQRSASYLFSPQGSLDRRATTPPLGGSRNRTPIETLAVLQIENSPTGSTITAGAREEGGVRGSGRAMLLLPVFHAGQTARANCCLLLLAVLLLLSRLPRAFRDACRAPASPLQHTQTHTRTQTYTQAAVLLDCADSLSSSLSLFSLLPLCFSLLLPWMFLMLFTWK